MQKSFIKRFQIKGLFNSYDVDIPFENNFNILVGENGIGKTTILNCLNYVLQCDVDNLYNINFKTIILTFGNNKKVKINHDDLITDEMLDIDARKRHMMLTEDAKFDKFSLVSLIKKEYAKYIPNIEDNKNKRDLDLFDTSSLISRKLRINYGLGVSRLYVEKVISEFNVKEFNNWESDVQNMIDENIIYLPTYRRIEDDFNKVMSDDFKVKGDVMRRLSNMQFGMRDVEQLIKNTCDDLKDSTNEGFKEMTSNLLKNYVKLLSSKEKVELKWGKIDSEILRIIFLRLADKIDEDVQNSIIDVLLDQNKEESFEYNYLVSIINDLVEIYDKTRNIDESLNEFVNVCNNYLENKTLIYDKFKVECSIIQNDNQKEIQFKNLSSGEKQIVSLFSKLYFSKTPSNIVLFDEPELSLSILWQSRLLPDIIASKKCKFMLVITHSPFIFDNYLQNNAIYIDDHIKVIKKAEEDIYA